MSDKTAVGAPVGIVVVVYSVNPEPLIQSIEIDKAHPTRWYIFFHGYDRKLLLHVQGLCESLNGHLYPFCDNRGVARSWNDGIIQSIMNKDDITMLINDDVFFYKQGFNKFINFVKEKNLHHRDYLWCTPYGFESQGATEGTYDYQQTSCCALGHAAIEQLGFFDENFHPVYYEDSDYVRRNTILGLPVLIDDRVLVEHARSYNVRNDPVSATDVAREMAANTDYYIRKWGGLPLQEQFIHPFNDPAFDCYIAPERRRSPYGPDHDRDPVTRMFPGGQPASASS